MRFFRGQYFLYFILSAIVQVEYVSGQPPGSKLIVKSPERLVIELDHRDSLFGLPPYGASIEQKVYYANDDLCEFTFEASQSWEPPFILMIERGGCSFVTKIRNAQRLGAAAGIIADNTCRCSDANCNSEPAHCEKTEPIMADDGSGADVSIPSMLIFKTDADPLIQELRRNTEIVMEMSYILPSPDDRVEYDIFTVPTDAVFNEFLGTWKPLAKALGMKAFFTPHMYIYDGFTTNCVGDDGQSKCFNLCTNKGRYCATDPDNDLEKGISGADVVTESLRRICIWNKYGEDGIGEIWWDYVYEFENRCSLPDYFANEDCISDVYTSAGVDGDAIARCMVDSGGLEENQPNSLLDLAIAAQMEMGVVVLPTIFVNTVALRGQLSSESLFEAICSGFAEGSAPEVCATCVSCRRDLAICVKSNACPRTEDGGAIGSGPKTTGEDGAIGNSVGNNIHGPPGSSSQGPTQNRDCELNQECVAMGLIGLCCPTTDDTMLGCCNGEPSSGDGTIGNSVGNNIDGPPGGNDSNHSNGGSSTSGNNAVGGSFSNENINTSNGSGITSENGATTGKHENDWSALETNEETVKNASDPIVLGLGMLSALFESFGGSEICGLNFEELAEAPWLAEASSGNTDALLDSIQLNEQCSSSQEQNFQDTLEEFESCSGWDIKEVIETLPSAMVGTAMRCIMKAITVTDVEAETIFRECAEVILDDNPLGNAFKRILLEPAKNCVCLGTLSEVPECQLDVWPIPVFGSGLKTSSCLLTTLGCGFLQPLCDSELATLANCLPEENSNEELCNAPANCEDSILLSLPPPLAGMPMPDACRRANPTGFAGAPDTIVARYEKYVEQCLNVTEFWTIHEPSSPYSDDEISNMDEEAMDDSLQEEESTISPSYKEGQQEQEKAVLGGEKVDEESMIQGPSTIGLEERSTSESWPASGFVNGLVTGVVASAALAVSVLLLYHKNKSRNNHQGVRQGGRSNDERGLYSSVELT